jgi:hypothetical protein
MKTRIALGTMLAVALIAPAALPCGAPFGNGINVDPKQDIVVVHKNGSETYVFQPRFCGSAKEFGLILPVPAKLTAQPALSKADVFTKLDQLSKPQYTSSTQCGYPDRGTGGSKGNAADAGIVGVVSSGTVGFMDYAQLETSSLDALTSWLQANGYPYDSLATSAFDYYVQKGWLFLTFKVSQGEFTGTTTCKDLGPVKFSFPTTAPVVPTRMATARSKDTSGSLSYATRFSWRIFGITVGSEQIGFADTSASTTRVLNFSGLLVEADVSSLDGLATAGDRATKMTINFDYGSTAPDVAFNTGTGKDYREVINQVTYVDCKDAGTDSVVAPQDAPIDLGTPLDATVLVDTGVEEKTDAAPGATDTVIGYRDAGVPISADAAVVVATADASTGKKDATTTGPVEQPEKKSSGGCSFLSSSSTSAFLPVLIAVGLLLGMRRRRR